MHLLPAPPAASTVLFGVLWKPQSSFLPSFPRVRPPRLSPSFLLSIRPGVAFLVLSGRSALQSLPYSCSCLLHTFFPTCTERRDGKSNLDGSRCCRFLRGQLESVTIIWHKRPLLWPWSSCLRFISLSPADQDSTYRQYTRRAKDPHDIATHAAAANICHKQIQPGQLVFNSVQLFSLGDSWVFVPLGRWILGRLFNLENLPSDRAGEKTSLLKGTCPNLHNEPWVLPRPHLHPSPAVLRL